VLNISDYDITYHDGSLDITKAALSVTADNKSKVYDGTAYSPFTVTYNGFVTGEGATNLGAHYHTAAQR